MEEVLFECELVLLVVPSDKVEATIEKAKQFLKGQSIINQISAFESKIEKTVFLAESRP